MHIAALLLSAVLFQSAPAVTTGPAESITTGSAVVTGTVDPNGEATSYRVEYGTGTTYGLTTAAQDAGSGDDPVDVRVTLTGLTASTAYHYRVVATNASGDAQGSDRTLTTATPPRAPSITSRSALGVFAIGATLRASVNPRSLATTVHFEYGTTTAYGSVTPEQAIGAGGSGVTVTAAIGSLTPATRYQYRAVARSAAGVTRGANRSFSTTRAPTGVAITPSTRRPVWGTGITLFGKVSGVGSTPVALEKQDFPYSGPFVEVATARATSSGSFTLNSPALFTTARLRVVTRTPVVATSPVTTASVAVRVGLKRKHLKGTRYRLEGTISPRVSQGRVSLQRQSRSGRWIPVARKFPFTLSGGRSRVRFTVKRRARALNYRLVAVPNDGGAHVNGTSRTVKIRKR